MPAPGSVSSSAGGALLARQPLSTALGARRPCQLVQLRWTARVLGLHPPGLQQGPQQLRQQHREHGEHQHLKGQGQQGTSPAPGSAPVPNPISMPAPVSIHSTPTLVHGPIYIPITSPSHSHPWCSVRPPCSLPPALLQLHPTSKSPNSSCWYQNQAENHSLLGGDLQLPVCGVLGVGGNVGGRCGGTPWQPHPQDCPGCCPSGPGLDPCGADGEENVRVHLHSPAGHSDHQVSSPHPASHGHTCTRGVWVCWGGVWGAGGGTSSLCFPTQEVL